MVILPLISDLRINIANLRQAVKTIVARSKAGRGYTFFTFNLDHLVKLDQDRRFSEAYERADFVTADGWPIVWRIGQAGHTLERTTGADLLEPVCAQAAANDIALYFVGPSPRSQGAGLKILRTRYPGIPIAGAEAPDISMRFGEEVVEALAQRINASGARLCVLSLGAPKQELLADALHERCPEVGFLCFGAALDFISGHALRAPMWMRRSGLEWCWRLAAAPRRMSSRYLQCAVALFKLSCPALFPRSPQLTLVEAKDFEEARAVRPRSRAMRAAA